MEIRKKIIPIQVTFGCDECNGEVLSTGRRHPNQALFEHQCRQCKKVYMLEKIYPHKDQEIES